MNRSKRNSNLEVLRIVSMLFIILNHYSGEVPWKNINSVGNIAAMSYMFYKPFGQIGVDIFVLITGYFLSQKVNEPFSNSVKRALRVWLEVLFYSLLLLIIGSRLFKKFSVLNLLKGILPVTFNNY